MKIATWNIRHGGGKRVKDIVGVIRSYSEVDVFIITEFRNNNNKDAIIKALNEVGFTCIQTTNSESKVNSVLIAAKFDYDVQLFDELGEHKQRVIKLKTPYISIYGCYFPQKKLKSIIFEFILKEIKSNPKENILVVGDFNTGKHYLDENGATFYCSEYFDKIEKAGLTDAWRLINGSKKEFSWFSNAGNGFRIDHFFVSNSIKGRVIKCQYDHSLRENKVSDHSLMTLQLYD